MEKIRRMEKIEGTTLAGIVKNSTYYYTKVEVYQDGIINAWELNDLLDFKERFTSKRLAFCIQIPIGEILSVHNLGNFKVVEAKWQHTPASYLQLLQETVKKLNPNLDNLYRITDEQKAQNEKRRIAMSSKWESFRVIKEHFYQTEIGEETTLFMKHEGRIYHVSVTIFKSGTVKINHSAFELELDLAELEQLWFTGVFFTELEEATKIDFAELGELTLVEEYSVISLEEKLAEIKAAYDRVQGKSRHEVCQNRYYQYLANPSDFNREELRATYLAIPEGERMYLGDMDTRDGDYVRILFTDRKREV